MAGSQGAPITDDGNAVIVPTTTEPVVASATITPQTIEPQVTTNDPSNRGRMFTAEEVEAARRQEKDKLYTKLETMENEVKSFRQQQEEAANAQRAALEAAEAEKRRLADEEASAKDLLSRKDSEWNEKFEALRKDHELTQAKLEMEQKMRELLDYRNQRLTEEAANVMPELRDYVMGNTVEEIEAALSAAKERTASIVASVQASMGQQQQRPPARGASVTAPPVGPMEMQNDHQTLTADDIRNMDMNTYIKMRPTLLGNRAAQPNRGLFGG